MIILLLFQRCSVVVKSSQINANEWRKCWAGSGISFTCHMKTMHIFLHIHPTNSTTTPIVIVDFYSIVIGGKNIMYSLGMDIVHNHRNRVHRFAEYRSSTSVATCLTIACCIIYINSCVHIIQSIGVYILDMPTMAQQHTRGGGGLGSWWQAEICAFLSFDTLACTQLPWNKLCTYFL